jgi:hypothetical protein
MGVPVELVRSVDLVAVPSQIQKMKNFYEEEIQRRVVGELITLPAFSLKKTRKETLGDFIARKISINIDANNSEDIKKSIGEDSEKNTLPSSIKEVNKPAEVNKLPNWLERLKISFDILPPKDKFWGYLSLALFAIAFFKRLFLNIPIRGAFPMSIALLWLFLFLYFFSRFSKSFSKSNTNIEATFSQIRRLLKPTSDYAQDFSSELNSRKNVEYSDRFICEKSEFISKKIIEDEILNLDYASKSANWFYILYSSSLTFIVLYVSGDSLGILIKLIVDYLGFKDIKFFKDLTMEGLATLILFPLFFSLSKDIVALGLGARNKLLRRSLAILEDRFEYRNSVSK